jgi:hypothetical protein
MCLCACVSWCGCVCARLCKLVCMLVREFGGRASHSLCVTAFYSVCLTDPSSCFVHPDLCARTHASLYLYLFAGHRGGQLCDRGTPQGRPGLLRGNLPLAAPGVRHPPSPSCRRSSTFLYCCCRCCCCCCCRCCCCWVHVHTCAGGGTHAGAAGRVTHPHRAQYFFCSPSHRHRSHHRDCAILWCLGPGHRHRGCCHSGPSAGKCPPAPYLSQEHRLSYMDC